MIIKPGFLPGLLTIVVCILLWKGVSLLFLPIFLPGPLVLLDRVIEVYGDPASYIVVW